MCVCVCLVAESPGRPFMLFTLPDVLNTTTLLLSDDEETLFVGARDTILSLNISKTGRLQLSKKVCACVFLFTLTDHQVMLVVRQSTSSVLCEPLHNKITYCVF